MQVQPVNGMHPPFARWIERRRQRMQAQVEALDAERFDDLAQLIDADDEDRPPPATTDEERDEYRRMLMESRELSNRMAEIRSRLLGELRDVERKQVRGPIGEKRSHRGRAVDGYM